MIDLQAIYQQNKDNYVEMVSAEYCAKIESEIRADVKSKKLYQLYKLLFKTVIKST